MHRDAQRQVYELMAPKPHLQALPKERGRNRRSIGRCFLYYFHKLDQLKEFGALKLGPIS
jgi:RNA polymerase sigma-70 factor (ECF subfamily)